MNEKLLTQRNRLNKTRPGFRMRTAGGVIKLRNKSWRKPKGRHNKLRERIGDKGRRVEIGFRGPAEARGLTSEGKNPIVVAHISQLNLIDKSKDIALLSSTMGLRKREAVLKKADEIGLEVSNASLEKVSERIKSILGSAKKKREEKREKEKEKKKLFKKGKEKKAEEKKPATGKQEPEASGQSPANSHQKAETQKPEEKKEEKSLAELVKDTPAKTENEKNKEVKDVKA